MSAAAVFVVNELIRMDKLRLKLAEIETSLNVMPKLNYVYL